MNRSNTLALLYDTREVRALNVLVWAMVSAKEAESPWKEHENVDDPGGDPTETAKRVA